MPYNNGDITFFDILVNSPYSQNNEQGGVFPPPGEFFLLDNDGENLLDNSGDPLLIP